jgi:ABC-type uncharacterized transport system permease subunit
MPISTLSGIVAILFYAASLGLHSHQITLTRSTRIRASRAVVITGLIAVAAHLISAWTTIVKIDGYHFGIIAISTLIFAAISLLTLITSVRKPLGTLIPGIFPLAMLTIVLTFFINSTYPAQTLSTGLAVHVLLSVLAYSFVTLAALQAAFLAFQNYQLRHKHAAAVIRRFPPLQDMEKLLFELLWVAQILLTLALAAGFLFVENLRLPGLPHKMFFSVLAWTVFAVLLWGRHQLGWRGNTAIRGTLIGFVLLLLGFYGSKFVIEYILGG